MKELFNKLTSELCKVDIVCTNAEPNWLGWICLGTLGWICIAFIFIVISFTAQFILSQ